MITTMLVRRAVGGLQIRVQDGVYQVIQAPVRPTTTPLFTSRSLENAEKWRATYVAQADAVMRRSDYDDDTDETSFDGDGNL